jgi:membrane protease YdiL (CAAX protease family)
LSGGFLPSAAPRPIDARTAVLTFVVAWLLGQVVASVVLLALHGEGPATEASVGVLAAVLASAWTCWVVSMWWTSQRHGAADFAADYGVRFRAVDVVGLGIGAVCNLVLIRLVYLPLEAIWPDTFNEDRLNENAEDLVELAGGGSTVLLFVMVAVGAPFAEEFFYRGLLQRSLVARFNETAVVVAVAALFAVVHFRPVEYVGLFAIGLVFGVAALRTGRLGLAVMIHVGFNATGLLRAL